MVAALAERDMPLGNFFQRYLYNAFGSISFIVPSSRANYRYFRFLLANQPRLLFRVARSQGWFMLQLLRRMARPPDPELQRAAQWRTTPSSENWRSGAVSASGCTRSRRSGSRAPTPRERCIGMGRQVAKLALGLVLGAVFVVALLTASAHAIDSLAVGFGLKALLSLMLYVAFGTLAAVALVAAAIRLPVDEPPRPLRIAAARIAALLDVPIVTFGHTHEEVVSRSSGAIARWYFNTGTWVAVFSHDVLVPRPTVQYTFLRVRDHDAELLQWSPGRSGALPIVLLEDDGVEPDLGTDPARGAPHDDADAARRRSA